MKTLKDIQNLLDTAKGWKMTAHMVNIEDKFFAVFIEHRNSSDSSYLRQFPEFNWSDSKQQAIDITYKALSDIVHDIGRKTFESRS